MITKEIALAKFDPIVKRSMKPREFKWARLYVESVFDDRTPTWELGLKRTEVKMLSHGKFRLIRDGDQKLYERLINELLGVLRARGYREGIFTKQEHDLMGSSGRGDNSHPHKPIRVIERRLTVEEAQRARELVRFSSAEGRFYPGVEAIKVKVSLEPLDSDGNTVRDPRLVDPVTFEIINGSEYLRSANFPFRRD